MPLSVTLSPLTEEHARDAVTLVEALGNLDDPHDLLLTASQAETDTAGGVVALTEQRDVIGASLWTTHETDTSINDVLSRPVPCSEPTAFGVLEGVYVLPTYRNQGIGTQLVEDAIEAIHHGEMTNSVYSEVRVKHFGPDAGDVLDSVGFEMVFHEAEYWAHPETGIGDELCVLCQTVTRECDCGGAVYRYDPET